MRAIDKGNTRYAEIRAELEGQRGAAPLDGTISRVLRELTELGLAEKQMIKESTRQVWTLTELGQTVLDRVAEIETLTDLNQTRSASGYPSADAPSAAPPTTNVEPRGDQRTWGMSMGEREQRARAFDPSVAHPARRYDYLLGGKTNFPADRASADEIEALMPTVRLAAIENRAFLQRVVTYLSRQGVRQFLDIGSGIPTSPNTHEIAQRINRTARVVYVDNDPIVLTHSRALLTSTPEGRTACINGDLRDPRSILESTQLRDTLDLSEPVGLLLVAVLHFIRDDEDPRSIITALVQALPSDSWIAVSHVTWEYVAAETVPRLHATNRDGRFQARTGAQLHALLDGLKLLEPGIQSITQWWAEMAPEPRPGIEDVAINGALARVTTHP